MTVKRTVASISATVAVSLVMLSGSASAAQPRRSTSIKSSLVKLSDLFSSLEAGQDCAIGPAPAPGQQIIIEQPQLTAIAEQFGVDWQPGIIPARVVVERAARSVTSDELLPLINSALIAAGAPDDIDIRLGTHMTLVIPAEVTVQPDVETLNYDHGSGRFTAQLLFDTPGVEPMRLRVAGTAQEMVELPVLTHDMGTGDVITSSDLRMKRLRKNLVGDKAVTTVQDSIGLAARHRLTADNIITLDELIRPLLVSRGMPVVLRLEDTGLVLLAKGEAIEGGSLNDRIHVLNPSSRAVLVARVTGTGTVQIDPASTPVLLASQQAGLPQPYSLTAMPKFRSQ